MRDIIKAKGKIYIKDTDDYYCRDGKLGSDRLCLFVQHENKKAVFFSKDEADEIRDHLKNCPDCNDEYMLIKEEMTLSPAEEKKQKQVIDGLFKKNTGTIARDIQKVQKTAGKNLIPFPITSLEKYNTSGCFKNSLAAETGAIKPLGEIEISLEKIPNHHFAIRLFMDSDSGKYYMDFKSRNHLDSYYVVYRENSGEQHVLFSDKTAGPASAGIWIESIEIDIAEKKFHYKHINKKGFNDKIFVIVDNS